nr:uncharacterized protein LOC112743284 [Arachis hypogaea]
MATSLLLLRAPLPGNPTVAATVQQLGDGVAIGKDGSDDDETDRVPLPRGSSSFSATMMAAPQNANGSDTPPASFNSQTPSFSRVDVDGDLAAAELRRRGVEAAAPSTNPNARMILKQWERQAFQMDNNTPLIARNKRKGIIDEKKKKFQTSRRDGENETMQTSPLNHISLNTWSPRRVSCDRVFNAITHVRNTISETTTIANGSLQSDMPNTHDCDNIEVNSSYKEVDRRVGRPRTKNLTDASCPAFQNEEYWHMGDTSHECEYCHALFWYDERIQKHYNTNDPKYTLCCRGGQVEIPHLQEAPKMLYDLLFGNDTRSKHFQNNIRTYNSMFQFTSLGAKIDRTVAKDKGPRTFILYGKNYHLMGSLIPQEGDHAKFAQLYVFDTHNEIENRISAISGENTEKVHEDIVRDLKIMLDQHNVLVKAFRMAGQKINGDATSSVKLRLLGKRGNDGRRYNLPSTNEVAALIVGDFDLEKTDRDIVVETRSGRLQRINQLNPSYLGLQYPLYFPYGEDGFKEHIPLNKGRTNSTKGHEDVTMKDFFAFRIQERLADGSPLLYSRRLFQQFLVDGYSMVESARLTYIRLDQDKFRCEMYKGISEAVLMGETTPSSRGKCIILPSSFTGGPRYMIQNYQDAMAICNVVGYPDLFLTFTCNPKWPKLEDFLKNKDLNAEDRPDMKRGLPHAHILVFLHRDDKYPTADDIDQIISAEIPDKDRDPLYYEAVEKHMMHGPCGSIKKDSSCMENGKCIRHFPKKFVNNTTIDEDGYPVYRRRDDGKIISKCGVELDNRYVVPHNRKLLLRYGAHINVEWCNQSRSIKYLFKYVNKGNDRVTASFYGSGTADAENDECDEVSMYYDCRYISPCEAAWRIFGYGIHFRDPSVVRLGFHLPGEQPVVFQDHENLEDVVKKASVKESMFLGWFEANKKYGEARSLTYSEFPSKFVWKPLPRKWFPRKSHSVIGRIFFVPPRSGEIYYLRLLLNFVRGPTSYEDIRTIDGILYPTFRDACYAQGILDDDKEYIDAIEEANLHMTETEIRDLTLIEIENLLKGYNKSLRDIPSMPFPNMDMCYQQLMSNGVNRLICDELRYDKRQLVVEHADLLQKLTDEQKRVYKQILAAVNSGDGGVFFLYGYGGTGKTFVWKTLAAAIRSKGQIVLMVASSGIASLLLPGGRTSHSRFVIPINLDEFSTCNINQNSPLAELIIRCKLIIWDEAPMVNRLCIEALDRTMRDILRFKNANSLQQPFGGKTVVFGGDFRQILPVIPKGSRQDIVNATINSSYIWDSCKLLSLTQNMRLRADTLDERNNELKQFVD